MTLPVALDRGGNLVVPEPDTGELVELRAASDRALAATAHEVADLERRLVEAKRALAAELRDRYGVGAVHAGGYGFTIAESHSWPVRATQDALARLVATGAISGADAERAMPRKPSPDKRALKALLGRLVVANPDAARMLSEAATVSPASVRDITRESVDGEVAS